MKGRHANERDRFERLVRQARMERAVYLGEAIAGTLNAWWNRIHAFVSHGDARRAGAAR